MKAWMAAAVAAAVPVLITAGCGGNGVPDAFGSGVPHGHVLMDRVDCDPAPDTCARYVIVAPAGVTTDVLRAAVTRRVERSLHWRPTSAPEMVETDEGAGYDGPGTSGGYVNTADAELRFWARVGYAAEIPPNPTLQRAEELMRARPDAIVVWIARG